MSDDKVKITLSLSHGEVGFVVKSLHSSSVVTKEVYCQSDMNGPKTDLGFLRKSEAKGTKVYHSIFRYAATENLAIKEFSGNRVSKLQYDEIIEKEGQPYRIFIAFSVDDELYTADFLFNVKATKEYYLEWFATGSM